MGEESVEDYLSYLSSRRYSKHTEIAYRKDLEEWSDFCRKILSLNPEEANPSDVRQWIVALMEQDGMGPKTVRRKIATLRSYYKYLMTEGRVRVNPARVITLPKLSKRLPNYFREEEMDRVLNDVLKTEAKQGGLEEQRDELIIDLFYQTGVRVSEMVNIRDSDVDFGRASLRVVGKRNKERRIPMGAELMLSLHGYMENKRRNGDGSGYLFERKNGEPMYVRGVYAIVHKYMSMVSTQSKRSPHVLRHTFASTLLNNGADINAVKELLGHSSLAATEIYTHTSFARLLDVYRKAHPRDKK
ncbi:MAG: tyrosine-type recombinase/integrase [Paludibacteraceae bacterium]|nr:tyrosine-type recombinase/integrase [Paludibacteraceae bacterium]